MFVLQLHGFDVITGQRMNISWYDMPRTTTQAYLMLWEAFVEMP